MILDYALKFSDAQAVTAAAASSNIVDQGAAGDAYGNELFLVVRAGVAAAAAGAATVNFQLQTATDSAFTVPVTLFDSGAIGKAAITANTEIVKVKLPLGALRYLRVYYSVATGPLTAGTFDAFLTNDVQVKGI